MPSCEKEPLALSPRSSGTNIRTSLIARSHEVPGLRTFLSQVICFFAVCSTNTGVYCQCQLLIFQRQLCKHIAAFFKILKNSITCSGR